MIAAWLKALEVYDAYSIACYLQLIIRRYRNEFLLHRALDSDSYRILATFHGTPALEKVALTIPDRAPFEAIIPIGFARSMQTAIVDLLYAPSETQRVIF